MRLIAKLLMLLMVSAALSGCSGAMIVFTDTKLSSETGLDCSVSRWIRNEPICIDPTGGQDDGDAQPNVTCYETLGNIDCYEETDPYAAGARKTASPKNQVAYPNLTPHEIGGGADVRPPAKPGARGDRDMASITHNGAPPFAVGGGSPVPKENIPQASAVGKYDGNGDKEKWYNFSMSKMWGTDYLKDQFKSMLTEKPFGDGKPEPVPEPPVPSIPAEAQVLPRPSLPGMQSPMVVPPSVASSRAAPQFRPPVTPSNPQGAISTQAAPEGAGPKAMAVTRGGLLKDVQKVDLLGPIKSWTGLGQEAPKTQIPAVSGSLPQGQPRLQGQPRFQGQPAQTVTNAAPPVRVQPQSLARTPTLNVAPQSAGPKAALPNSAPPENQGFSLFRSPPVQAPQPQVQPQVPGPGPSALGSQPSAVPQAPVAGQAPPPPPPPPAEQSLSDLLAPRSGPGGAPQNSTGAPRSLFNLGGGQ